MKLLRSTALLMALLGIGLQEAWAQEPGTEEPTTEEPAAEETEEDKKDTETIEPKGDPTRPHQYILDQGTVSFDGFEILDKTRQRVVGRLDGQTGWTGVNQAGEKTMSYQLAFVIQANEDLRYLFDVNREAGQRSMLGWWVPDRNEDLPPEKWQMNLIDIDLRSAVVTSELEVHQTLFNKGVYAEPGDSIPSDFYKEQLDTNYNRANWKFDRATGILTSWEEMSDSLVSMDEYWVPVGPKTMITDDRLVIVVEGISLKPYLPDVRGQTKIPIRMQIVDFIPDSIDGYILRQGADVTIEWSGDYNRCTLPAECKVEKKEEDSAVAMSFASAVALVTALLAF